MLIWLDCIWTDVIPLHEKNAPNFHLPLLMLISYLLAFCFQLTWRTEREKENLFCPYTYTRTERERERQRSNDDVLCRLLAY